MKENDEEGVGKIGSEGARQAGVWGKERALAGRAVLKSGMLWAMEGAEALVEESKFLQ